MNKIRLLIDGHWFDDLYQSPSVFLKGLYDHIALDDDYELFLAAFDTEVASKQFKNFNRINFVKFRSQSKIVRLAYDFNSIIKKNKIDVAHYQYISPIIKTCKEIITIHDLLYRDFKSYFPLSYRIRNDILFKRSAKRADLITSVSNYSIDSIANHFNIPRSKLVLVPNGISEDFYNYTKSNVIEGNYELKKYILCVSRIEPRKNHILLLKAYVELKLWQQDVKLVLIGREDIPVLDFDNCIIALPSNVKEHVLNFKNVGFDLLKEFYANALLVVYPSFAEGFGIPPLEAAALGAKVLCSKSTAMADFDFFGDDLFDPHNLTEFKEKLSKAIVSNDYSNRSHLSKRIKEKYNWLSIANDYSNAIKKMFR